VIDSPIPETTLAIIGAGSWGTALACVLAQRFDRVNLWAHEPDLAVRTEAARVNDVFLPGIRLPDNVRIGHVLSDALEDAGTVLSVMPSHVVRAVYERMLPHLDPGMHLVSATKGLEAGSLMRASEVIRDVMGSDFRIAVLSGPTFAREVAQGSPTALVVASQNEALAGEIQAAFSTPKFRVYRNADPAGVEIGGSLKNIVAIGAGICDGLGLGHNAVAALITRGLAEMTRLAIAAGGCAETLAGLAGLGDLVLTCTGELSRNRRVGFQLASGARLEQVLASTPMVAEGVGTTAVALQLAEKYSVDLPIARQMHAVLHLGRSPGEAVRELMTRTLRSEW
jgi:glycerol-3-phosphate dehydrogenase (NAD(P)+)